MAIVDNKKVRDETQSALLFLQSYLFRGQLIKSGIYRDRRFLQLDRKTNIAQQQVLARINDKV